MGQGQIPYAQFGQHAQDGERVADAVPALGPDEPRDTAAQEGRLHLAGGPRRRHPAGVQPQLGRTLLRVQHELFNLGSILATLPEDQVRNGMAEDFSWNTQGARYVELYERVLRG